MNAGPRSIPPGIRLEAAAARAVDQLLRLVPRSVASGLGALAGDLFGRIALGRYRITIDNLEKAFGAERSRREIRRIARGVFRHFGRAAFEILTMDRCAPSDVGTVFDYEGLENIRRAYARGRGVFLYSAHFGNWELVALMQGYLGMPLALITRPLDNPLLEDLMRGRREASGNRVIGKRSAVRQALRALSDGLGVAIVIDQNVRSGARVFVDFFGRPASTTPTLALLALKTEAPIIPVFSFPQPGARYRIVYGPEVPVVRTGDLARDVRTLTEHCTRIVEREIRNRPECWLWMHERWKTRPTVRDRQGVEEPAAGGPS